MSKPLWKRALLALFVLAVIALDVLIIIYHKPLLHQLVVASEYWHSLGLKGQLVILLALFTVSFPPVGGFTLTVTVAGAIYGIRYGMWLTALGSTVGSACSFWVVSRMFRERAQRMVENNRMLKMVTVAVRDSETSLVQETLSMILIKVLPLPYSLTNGAVACVPDASIWCYATATFLSAPKNIVSLFVGAQMRKMGEPDQGNSLGRNLAILAAAAAVYGSISFFLYRRVQQRMEQQQLDQDGWISSSSAEPDEQFVV